MITYDWRQCPAATSDYDDFGPLAYEDLGFGPYVYVSQRATGERATEPLAPVFGINENLCWLIAGGAVLWSVMTGRRR